jgi:peptidylprolyl isomerase
VKRYLLLATLCAGAVSLAALSCPSLAASKKEAQALVAKLTAPPPTAADFRTVDPENVLVIDTTQGRVYVEMFPELAPATVAQVKALTRDKFYDGLTFHRVIDKFMAQGGDPKGDGTGGSTRPNIPGEFIFRRGPDTPFVRVTAVAGQEDGFIKSLPVRTQNTGLMIMTADGKVQAWGLWCKGVAGFARAGEPDTGNSQFFLMRDFSDALERNYTAWGHVLAGQNVVDVLKKGEPPPSPDRMVTVRVLADLPAAARPKVSVLDTQSAAFKALAANAVSVCDIDLPAKIE